MSGSQKKIQERGIGNFQPTVCISLCANENPSVIIASSPFLNSLPLHCEFFPAHFAHHSKWRAWLQARQKEWKLFKSQIITFQTSHCMRGMPLCYLGSTYVCHILLSSMLHEFLWVRKLLMYNILLLGVHRLFYLGTNSWLTGEAANNTQSWQFCLLSVQLSCKATRRIMVHSFTALTHVFTAFFRLLPNKPPTKQATHWCSVIKWFWFNQNQSWNLS